MASLLRLATASEFNVGTASADRKPTRRVFLHFGQKKTATGVTSHAVHL
jgi:hypothetical protein